MQTKFLIAAALICSGPALAQSVGEKTGANAVLGITPSTEDFVLQAAQSEMFETQSSTLAAANGGDNVKDFANHMIEAHKTTTGELRAAVQGNVKAAIPTEMSSSQQSELEKLKGLKGDDLSDRYVDDQVSAHKNAVSLFQRYTDGGDNPELKAWAAKTLPDLQHHLEMAQALDK